jgi:hypothetical protein
VGGMKKDDPGTANQGMIFSDPIPIKWQRLIHFPALGLTCRRPGREAGASGG